VAVRNAQPISRFGAPLLLALVVYASYRVVFERLALAKTWGWAFADYVAHAGTARDWWSGHGLGTPHFLFEALIIVCHILSPASPLPLSAMMAGAVSAVAAVLATYAFWVEQLPGETDRDYWVASLWCLGLQVVGPITLATIWVKNFYWGYIYPASTFHNPTIVILKPFALLSFALTLAALERSTMARLWWRLVGVCVAVILSALAKPNWLLCFLPGLVLTVLWDSRLRGRLSAWCVTGAVIVSGLSVLAWQYAFLYGQAEADQIIFTPQKWLSIYGWLAPLKLMLSIAFPVSVVVLFWNDLRNSLLLRLAWSTFGASLLVAYGFSETGQRAGDDNLGWSAQIALFVLFVASAVAMVGTLRTAAAARSRHLGFRSGIAVVIFILHVACGVGCYATYMVDRGRDWAWY
jgi:hypothetical protein